MIAAATAWQELAADLRSAATSYSSVISNLAAGWRGPSSITMAAAAAPYAAWMNTTAGQLEQTATQARLAAATYENALAATVPPPEIATNRSQLSLLVATNLFGQNSAAIAATEAQYAAMWAQDAAVMYGYAGQSATAAQVAPFAPPSQTINPAGLAAQSAAVTAATATSTGTSATSSLSQFVTAAPQALTSLAAPAAAGDPTSLTTLLEDINTSPLAGFLGDIEFFTKGIRPANDAFLSTSLGLVSGARATNDVSTTIEPLIFAKLPSGAPALGAATSEVSSGMGNAGAIGALTTPTSWAAATPTVRLTASMLQGAAPPPHLQSGQLAQQACLTRWAWQARPAALWALQLHAR